MVCPRCGHSTPELSGRCTTCGAALAHGTIAAGVIIVDTTGLPPDGTFGASTGLNPFAPTTGTSQASETPGTAATAEVGVAPMDASGPLRVGQSFSPRYHIIKILGVGGMGAVYQAWDAELSVAVALKVIRADRRRGSGLPAAEKRFKNELLLARQVTHKNIVRMHDLGEIDGIKYITMPYIQGEDLASFLRHDSKLPVGRVLRLARQIAGGLEAAHEAGVVHRDLKPANIMISGAGDDEHALIMDFGISASADQAADGRIVGTLEYMSPEQGTGQTVDARSDLYAFGLILYEMLVGRKAARTKTAEERIAAMKQRFEEGLPPLRACDQSIPEPLEALVMRCIERDPAARFQTTTELCAALAALDDAGEVIPIPARISKRVLRVAILFLLVLLAGMYVVGRRFAPVAPPAHEPVSVLIADFQNNTGDPAFDRTLEPMLKLALEGAGFISAYDRNGIGRILGVRPPEKLDERTALEIAVKQGLGIVLSGSLNRQGNGYGVSVKATQAVTGNVITSEKNRASSKEQVLGAATKLADAVREALGDDTSDSDKRFAMDTLSATSLEVVRDYAAAAMAMSNSRFEEARQHFANAAARDSNFGLAHAGLAIASSNLRRQQDAEKYIKEAIRHLDGMTERERYRTRGLFYYITGDYQQCVKEFGDLTARYAADASARNNLALCLTYLRNMPKAVEEMRQVVKILPKRPLYRENLAQYADYNSDFDGAEREARAIPEQGVYALLAIAFAQLGRGQVAEATATFQTLGKIDTLGASFAASGAGDLAMYEGRFGDAVKVYAQGADADLVTKDPDRAANKFIALASAHLARGQKAPAIAAAEKALAASTAVNIRFMAARIFVGAGAAERAQLLTTGLASELLAEPQAYAKIVDGEAALKNGEVRDAIKAFTEANALLDTWIGHFDLGRAYLEAGALTQADSEFDRCIKRRGEALALFLDEEPTYGVFPPVYYYQGRVREALGNARFAESYRAYLNIRGTSTEDPLLPDVRRRAR
jgi:eukaryotic-like serine/threonine-protein kinase